MVNEFENTLRKLILFIIGENPSLYKISTERILKWEEKREINSKKNKGILLESRLIYFSDFYDLKNIILKNWELFLPVLKNKKRFEVYFDEIENYRNDVAHGRSLTQSQEYLLNGISIDLKTLIAIYHNKNEIKEDYFIRIDKISDNLGNKWESGKGEPKVTLRVGDYYELLIEAHDPKGRKITYEIFTIHGFKMSQDSNRFNIIIENIMVGNPTVLYVTASTLGSEYKNSTGPMIAYTILPR